MDLSGIKANWLREIIHEVLGAVLYAAAIYFFVIPAKFATGGLGGIALILNHLFSLPVGVTTLVLNIPLIIPTWKILGKRFMIRSLRAMVIFTVLVDVVFPLFPYYQGDAILAALFGGVLLGASMGIIYRSGTSTGGTDFVIMAINKTKPHRSVGQLTVIADAIIILLGGVFFKNINAVLYGIVLSVVHSYVIDKILVGAVVGKIALIITDKPQEVSSAIIKETSRGATIFNGRGAYTGEQRHMVMCACSKAQVVHLRKTISLTDEKALVMISDYSETFGNGFQKL